MVTGAPPRDFAPGKDCWQVVLHTDAIPLRRRQPSVPARLAALIDHALIDDPAIPFQSAAELKQALLGAPVTSLPSPLAASREVTGTSREAASGENGQGRSQG